MELGDEIGEVRDRTMVGLESADVNPGKLKSVYTNPEDVKMAERQARYSEYTPAIRAPNVRSGGVHGGKTYS